MEERFNHAPLDTNQAGSVRPGTESGLLLSEVMALEHREQVELPMMRGQERKIPLRQPDSKYHQESWK